MKIYLIFGASGRVGRVVLSGMNEEDVLLRVKRNLCFSASAFKGEMNLDSIFEEYPNSMISVLDFSVDYTGIDEMKAHELSKREIITRLKRAEKLSSYVGISSGAVQFNDDLIQDLFYKEYAVSKKQQLLFLQSLNVPFFFPQVFTLIGPISFMNKKIGWVDVLESALVSEVVEIGDPFEKRSWVSESALKEAIFNFLKSPNGGTALPIVEGDFCLYDIAQYAKERINSLNFKIVKKPTRKWLNVPYVNGEQHIYAPIIKRDLESVLSECIDSHI